MIHTIRQNVPFTAAGINGKFCVLITPHRLLTWYSRPWVRRFTSSETDKFSTGYFKLGEQELIGKEVGTNQMQKRLDDGYELLFKHLINFMHTSHEYSANTLETIGECAGLLPKRAPYVMVILATARPAAADANTENDAASARNVS